MTEKTAAIDDYNFIRRRLAEIKKEKQDILERPAGPESGSLKDESTNSDIFGEYEGGFYGKATDPGYQHESLTDQELYEQIYGKDSCSALTFDFLAKNIMLEEKLEG